MCGFCDVENKKLKDPLNLFNDDDFERIIQGIVAGIITTDNLDYDTYRRIARKLSDGVFEGFGKGLDDLNFGTPDYTMLFDLRENVYIFSGAKVYQQTREIESVLKKLSGALTKGDQVQTFAQFKKDAKNILIKYNEDYLRAEYNSAIAQSRSASQWMQFEKDADILPMLTYHTVGDMRVRPTHAALDNISRSVHDKFWDSYLPPNGWNCRCSVIQSDDAIKTSLQGFKQPKDVPDIFMFNSGKERIVFSPKHPYFDIAPKDRKNAKNNFDLPLP
jgi:SPP1 gp7 family putative phage head morphogenesis protein